MCSQMRFAVWKRCGEGGQVGSSVLAAMGLCSPGREMEPMDFGDHGFFSHFSYSIVVSLIKSQTTKPGSVIPGFIGVDGLNGAFLI